MTAIANVGIPGNGMPFGNAHTAELDLDDKTAYALLFDRAQQLVAKLPWFGAGPDINTMSPLELEGLVIYMRRQLGGD